MSWNNDDGLYIRFGTEKPVVALGGESTTDGNNRVITLDLTYADFAATGTEKIISEGLTIPNGAFVKSAVFTVSTAFAGATATLTFGLIDSDRSTAYDADGIDAAIAVTAIDAVGDEITCDGAVVGTVISNTTPVYVTATEGTAAFTAGEGQLVITYYMP